MVLGFYSCFNCRFIYCFFKIENATKLLKEATDGNEKELRSIIEKGDADLEFTKQDKNTCLHLCAAYGYINCVKLLIAKVYFISCILFLFHLAILLMFNLGLPLGQ